MHYMRFMSPKSPENRHFRDEGHLVALTRECHLRAPKMGELPSLNGNLARRHDVPPGVIWDGEIVGFGLRVQATGYKSWVVKYRERRKQRFVTLGSTAKVDFQTARARAVALLERAALDGLPTRPKTKIAPTFADYIDEFWKDYAHHWKPSTRTRNRSAIRCDLVGAFGGLALDTIRRADVVRWRDDLSARPGTFNRALPVLAVMLRYAEQLGYRRKGSNPCKGMPRYKRELPDRFLSPAEYQRLARTLAVYEAREPDVVAAVRLLMFTGARQGEIASLRWEYVQPPRLMLPDSKTGAKIIWLNSPALDVIDALPDRRSTGFVFPARQSENRPLALDVPWTRIRKSAALPDVRLHDLRHSFASFAARQSETLPMIGKLLGHARIDSTARYTHLDDNSVLQNAERIGAQIVRSCGMIEDGCG